MSNQISTTLIMCILFGLFSFYYFNKFQESEKEYVKLHKRFDEVYLENQKMKSRIKDLQCYKNDVSKTMQILDNELMLINNHIQKQNPETIPDGISNRRSPYLRSNIRSQSPQLNSRNNISLLSPELLTSLFNNMNQEHYQSSSLQMSSQNNEQEQTDNIQNQEIQENNEINMEESETNLQPNEKIININYDITYTPNQSNYDQFLLNKQI